MPSLVILAAGMGSRYGGTKQFATFGPYQRLILDYTLYDAIQAGFDKVVCVIRRQIEPAFRESVMKTWEGKIDIRVVYQELTALPEGYSVLEGRTKPWGTAHAMWMAEPEVQEAFAIVNADDFYGREGIFDAFKYLNAMDTTKPGACIVGYKLENTLSEHGTVSRGVCKGDGKGGLKSIQEMKSIFRKGDKIVADEAGTERELQPDDLVSMNLMGFSPQVFPLIHDEFAKFYKTLTPGSTAEFYLAHVLSGMIQKGQHVAMVPTDSEWFGVTYPEDNDAVNARLTELHAAGVYPDVF
jgi:dTDP-glucose pyrophosphorylase